MCVRSSHIHHLLVCLLLLLLCSGLRFQTPTRARTLGSEAKKKSKSAVDAEVMEKVRRYQQAKVLEKLKKEGGSYNALKDSIINGTMLMSATASGGGTYKKFVGTRGSLEKRLQAIVAFKRASGTTSESSGLTSEEEEELEAMMESDDDFEDDEGNDEDAEYETLVMQAIEANKLNELKRNFVLDKAGVREELKETGLGIKEIENLAALKDASGDSENHPVASPAVEEGEDLYTPARSSWGVFQRPRDISKTFGGGRPISKEEMDRMDEEFELREKTRETAAVTWKSEALKKESENEDAIRSALDRGRGFMVMGNRKASVAALEGVSELCSWQSELGGEVLLELGMALETVDRTEDARKVYGKLASVSWSSTVRRNALQLIQGLDITKQIRKDLSPRKPAMDMQNLYLVQTAIEKGLLMDSDEFRRDKRRNTVSPWFGEEKKETDRVDTLLEAYGVLIRAVDPLRGQKVASSILIQAFRMLQMLNDADKMEFLRTRGVLSSIYVEGEKPKVLNRLPGSREAPREGTFFAMIGETETVAAPAAAAASGETRSIYSVMSDDPAPVARQKKPTAVLSSPANVFSRTVNGTWDLMVSLVDERPYSARRFESGVMRRIFDMKERQVTEAVPVFWGLSSSTLRGNFEWNEQRCEVTLPGEEFSRSRAPWHDKGEEKVFQVIYADEEVMLTCEKSSKKPQGPDLYSLWKRKLTVWRKWS